MHFTVHRPLFAHGETLVERVRVMLALKYSAGTKNKTKQNKKKICKNQTYQLNCLQTTHINHNAISITSSRRLTVLIAVAFCCFSFYLRQQNYPFAIIYFMILVFCFVRLIGCVLSCASVVRIDSVCRKAVCLVAVLTYYYLLSLDDVAAFYGCFK